MAKQVILTLSLDKEETLWWSSDGGLNWAPTGPQSPVTAINEHYEICWVCTDKSIEDIEIKIESGHVLESASGSSVSKISQINSNCKQGDSSKYTIVINGTIRIDPDVKYCPTAPCQQDA